MYSTGERSQIISSPAPERISRRKWLCQVALFCCLFTNFGRESASGSSESRKTVVVFGDSISAGYGLSPQEAFPALLQAKIDQNGWNYTVVNAGLSGETSAGGARRISWILKRPTDVLVIELGGNDGLRGINPEATQSNLVRIIQRAREKNPDMPILLAGMQMPDTMGREFTEKFRDLFHQIAREHNVILIPDFLQGVGGIAELNQPDLIHPTAEGHRILAENVWKVLEPVLSEHAKKQ